MDKQCYSTIAIVIFIIFGEVNESKYEPNAYTLLRAALSSKLLYFNHLVYCDKEATKMLQVCDQLFISIYLRVYLILFISQNLIMSPSNSLSMHHFRFSQFCQNPKGCYGPLLFCNPYSDIRKIYHTTYPLILIISFPFSFFLIFIYFFIFFLQKIFQKSKLD